MPQPQPEKIASALRKLVKGDVYNNIFHRVAYSIDASIYRIIPKCVVAPKTAEDVSAIVQYCRKTGLSVAARGAGSGVAGESLCSGVILDMTVYMNKIINIEDESGFATCQPGMVLSDLNNALFDYGQQIGPDPSSGNRATIGGIVANNATGAHSLQYGYIADYLEEVEIVLSDGNITKIGNNYRPRANSDEFIDVIASEVIELLNSNKDVIEKVLPESKRNRSGYNVSGITRDGSIDLARLLAGSEGTLGIITKVKLKTVPLPPATGVIQFEFDNLSNMARAVPKIVQTKPSSCELMDKTLIQMANESLPEYRDILPEKVAAVLCVEHFGGDGNQVKRKLKSTASAVGELAGSKRLIMDSGQQKKLAKARKDAVPLLYRTNSKRKPVPFIEDISVDNSRLDEYITELEKIGRENETQMVYYGHAGDGELHIRPYLDLGREDDVSRMQKIADRAFTLAWSLGGTISGEHGEGLVRAAFLRRQYGDEFYEILCRIKRIFDADSVLNPGKILNDDADIMIKNLQASQKIKPERLKSSLNFRDNELEIELEKCNGCGLCLSKESDLRMCPVFRATNDKMSSARVKANLLRYWAGGGVDEDELESKEFRKMLSMCVNCKACSLQCPSGVDISKLITETRIRLAKRQGLTLAQKMLSLNRYLSMAGSMLAPVANFFTSFAPFKWFLEKTVGLDRRRDMPAFEKGTFLKKGQKYLKENNPVKQPADRVAYFVDTFANYNDHSLGFTVLKVLNHNGIDVHLPKQRPAPVPAMYYGYERAAREDLNYSVKYLLEAIEKGRKIICSEPSAALCLKQELRHYIAPEIAEKISNNTYELMDYLEKLYEKGKLERPVSSVKGRFAYHQPCHLFALGNNKPGFRLLRKFFGLDIRELNAGCCGLGGTFGMQKKNYRLSQAISENLRRALSSSNCKVAITECGACGMQIEHISGLEAVHPIKIIAKAYSLDIE